jgi:hypothetical protein
MSSTVSMVDSGLWYRVNHPEFLPENAYRLLALTFYAESGWAYLTFVNEQGMTYAVKNWRGLCLNAVGGSQFTLEGYSCVKPWSPLAGQNSFLKELPWPRPSVKNPDLEDD